MPASEDLPPLSTPATIALIGLVALFWVLARVAIARRSLERGGAQTDVPTWLRRLAAWRGTYPALVVLAAGFAALLFV
jgi:hypothetical protein